MTTLVRKEAAPARSALRLPALALLAGIAFNVGLRGGFSNAVVVAGIVTVIAMLATERGAESSQARLLFVSAAAPALFLAVRTSPWLVGSNVLAVVVLTGCGAAVANSGSILDITPVRMLRRLEAAIRRAWSWPTLLQPLANRLSGPRTQQLVRIGLGAAVALPLLAAVVVLLASADAIFASLLIPDIDARSIVGHVVLTSICAGAALASAAAAMGDADDDQLPGRFGSLETATMLGLATGVLTLFVASQLVALTGAGRRLVDSSGLTPAEYARSGFFQLCIAAGILVTFLGLVRSLAAPGVMAHRPVRIIAGVVPLLALGLVVVCLRRMALYDAAFGLTMLRLWVIGAAVWIGLLLVMIAARNLGLSSDRSWIVAGAGVAALALVLFANAMNPESFVVRHNVARARSGVELDVQYLNSLSDDALPALVDALGRPDVNCGEDRTGVAAINLGARRAAAARRESCGS